MEKLTSDFLVCLHTMQRTAKQYAPDILSREELPAMARDLREVEILADRCLKDIRRIQKQEARHKKKQSHC